MACLQTSASRPWPAGSAWRGALPLATGARRPTRSTPPARVRPRTPRAPRKTPPTRRRRRPRLPQRLQRRRRRRRPPRGPRGSRDEFSSPSQRTSRLTPRRGSSFTTGAMPMIAAPSSRPPARVRRPIDCVRRARSAVCAPHLRSEPKTPWTCQLCHRKFNTQKALSQHLNIHYNERLWVKKVTTRASRAGRLRDGCPAPRAADTPCSPPQCGSPRSPRVSTWRQPQTSARW